MKNNITELVFLLDRSGSMSGLESDTIGGFNALIEKQKRQEGQCFVTTVLFDTDDQMLHDRVPLEQTAPMTDRDYCVGGCTALLDAMGRTVSHIERVHKYARAEDVPAHTVFVITTDGMENASREYSAAQIRRLVERKKKDGWEFLFLAANIDAVGTARNYGIEEEKAVKYHADSEGTALVYEAIGEVVCQARACRPISQKWKKKIEDHTRSHE